MTCFVCRGEAEQPPGYGGDYRYLCGGCGEYRVSTSLYDTIRTRVFDVGRTREELARQRLERSGSEGWGAQLPVLNSMHEYLLIDPE